jgi:polyisoprenoid-binding protein YceI
MQPYPGLGVTGTDDVLCVDAEHSIVHWLGTRIGGHHEGTVRIANGHLTRDETGITGGAFTVNMRSIDVTDIPPHEVEARRNLLHHLAHEEFFGVERFPTARFVVTDVAGISADVYTVSGNLAVRDSVHSVSFEASVPVMTSDRVRALANFSIDRRRWGVEFDGLTSLLRNAIVHNEIGLTIRILATTAACGKT